MLQKFCFKTRQAVIELACVSLTVSLELDQFFDDWKTKQNTKLSILTILKCLIHDINYIHDARITTIHFQNCFIITNRNSVPTKLTPQTPPSPAPGILYSTFRLYEFTYSKYFI